MLTIHLKKKIWEPANKYDIEDVLSKYNQIKDFKKEKLICSVCGNKVTFNNLGTAFEDKNASVVYLVCRAPICIRTYINQRTMNYH
ncbi:MAG: hypothetical protein GPJ54_11590 [Candidatus Heimdallarchaeota archaeon]|nr:hypothetical protein [Candidatus Heimdallarchaeota archaeon]